MTENAVLRAAQAAADVDICVLPAAKDGSKRPDLPAWKPYQRQRPSAADLLRWFRDTERTGLGFVCGAVSGGLELFEFDDPDAVVTFRQLAKEAGLGDLVSRIETGYCETTPGGGVHWLIKVPEVQGNTKLAQRPNGDGGVKVLIETRGEGGWVVVAPSWGGVHPTGAAYKLTSGGPATIATLTAEEHDELWALARTLDEMPRAEEAVATAPGGGRSPDSDPRPGDIFNEQASWREVLEPASWTHLFTSAGLDYWRRPGKQGRHTSATTGPRGEGADQLYVFSTSTPFKSEEGYSKFRAYAVLYHGSDWSAAARALAAKQRTDDRVSDVGPIVPSGGAPAPSAAQPSGLILASDVEPEEVEWLWPGHLALGKLTILDGDPALGKSTIVTDLAARVSAGRQMPDGQPGCGPAGVVLLSAEDGMADTIIPRLMVAGADRSLVGLLPTIGRGNEQRIPGIPDDVKALEAIIGQLEPRLLIIDPLVAYLGEKINTNSDHDVRRALASLAEMAERLGIALLVLRHLNKREGGNPLYRGGGSIGLIAAARVGLIVAPDPEESDASVLAVTKCNIGPTAGSLRYRVIGKQWAEGGRSGDVGAIDWMGQTNIGARQLLAAADSGEPSKLDIAVDFVRTALGEGDGLPTKEMEAQASDLGIAERTLKRARDVLGVVAARRGNKWYSTLPRIAHQGGQDPVRGQLGSDGGRQGGRVQDMAFLEDSESEEAKGVGPLTDLAPLQGGQGHKGPPSVPAPRVRCPGGCGAMVPPGQKCSACAADAVRAPGTQAAAAS